MSTSRSHHGGFVLGIGVSLAVHCVAVALLSASTSDSGSPTGGDPILLTDVDVPPTPPEAHDPVEETTPIEIPASEPEPEPTATVEPVPEPEISLEPQIDAGVPELSSDAGVASELPVDAGWVDAPVTAESDAGAEPLLAATTDAGCDAAVVAASASAGGLLDGGLALARALDGEPGAARTPGNASPREPVPSWVDPTPSNAAAETTGSQPAPGAASNLLTYFPPGEVVTLLIRLDRFRGTPWAERMEAVMRPMPDFQAIVGSRDLLFSDLFDVLVISSPRPRDVTATTLIGGFSRADSDVRRFLDHREARVAWSAGRGGVVGRRQRSALVSARDRRVFLFPYPGMVMLAPRRYLGPLIQPGRASTGGAVEAPAWVERVRVIGLEAGTESGPALLLTMAGFPETFEIPVIGAVPGPERATLAVELTEGGFLLRGNLLFASEARAEKLVAFAAEKQQWLVDTIRGRLLLSPFYALNAVKGLSLKRRGNKVAYATSISVADGRAMLDYAASWASSFFPKLQAEPPAKNAPPARRPSGLPGPSGSSPDSSGGLRDRRARGRL